MKVNQVICVCGLMMALTTCKTLDPAPLMNTNTPPIKRWDKTYGSNTVDSPMAVAFTKEGGWVVAGFSASDQGSDKAENSRGNVDFWVLKVNDMGQKVWEKTIGGGGNDYATHVVVLSDDSIVVLGYSDSGISGEKSEPSRGGFDYWVVKLNSTGQVVWDKTYGGKLTEESGGLFATVDGGFVVAGSSTSGVGIDKTESNRGERDFWLLKLSRTGEKQWDKTLGGRGNDHLRAISATADGNMVTIGSSTSEISNDKTERNNGIKPGTPDYWVVKVSLAGQKIWDKTLGGELSDVPSSIVEVQNGDFVVAGYSNSNISFDKTEATDKFDNDFWLVRITSMGQRLWDKTLGGVESDMSSVVLAAPDGGFLVVGSSFSGISRDKTTPLTGIESDCWILKINDLGARVWDRSLAADGSEMLPQVAFRKKDLVIVTASKSGVFGDKSQASKGDFDYWIVNLGFE